MKPITLFLRFFIVTLTAMSFLAVGAASGGWIYQENPDEEHPNYDHPLDGFYYFVNYNKPPGAIKAKWRVKHGSFDPYELDIPLACWNVDPTKLVLRLYSNSNNGHGGAESWPECFNGTNWVQVGKMTNGYYGGSGIDSIPQLMTDSDWDTYSVWNEIGPYDSKWQTDYSYNKTAPRWYEEAILWFVEDTSGCPSGMVSYWKFDDSADPDKDHYGNNHGIAILNSDWYSEGLIGGAMRFYGTSYSGEDSYIDIGADSSLDIQNLSIATWIKSDKPQQYWGCYISHCGPNYNDGWSAWWGCCAGGEDRQDKILWGVQGVEGFSGDTHLDTNWHFVVVTNDIVNNIREIYIDGQLDGTDVAYEYGNSGSVRIGQDTCYPERFSGWLDEMAIFNRALTATDIQQMYQSGLAGKGYCEAVNQPPTANAGSNISIESEDQALTAIQGTASDSDNDPLTYRWLEGETEISAWQDIGENGEAYLDLSTLPYLAAGQHNLILEVSDGQATASDDMILTIKNSAPHAAPTGSGVYKINSEVTLGGNVSDYDGDLLQYQWMEGTDVIISDTIQAIAGGTPVQLLPYGTTNFGLGLHTIVLQVDDGINDSVISDITVEIVDTTAPTLAPVANRTILWPPNHQMVNIVIDANAVDNSGLPVRLSAVVTSNEPIDGLGDGDTAPDWTEHAIDQENGIITLQLRTERSGLGDGRIYTITITASDECNNSSQAGVQIIVPHFKRKK